MLIIHGENDRLVPAWNSQRLAALMPDAQSVTFPETGHVPHEERPADFVEVVGSFLDSAWPKSEAEC